MRKSPVNFALDLMKQRVLRPLLAFLSAIALAMVYQALLVLIGDHWPSSGVLPGLLGHVLLVWVPALISGALFYWVGSGSNHSRVLLTVLAVVTAIAASAASIVFSYWLVVFGLGRGE